MKRILVAAVALVCLAVPAAFLLSGCEEDIATGYEGETPYSLYGFLNPSSDTQFIRVFPVVGQLEPARPEPLDAIFTSLDLTDGTTRTWQDSLVQYRDGTYGHVFWAPFRALSNHEYRLSVERSDGAVTYVDVDVPPDMAAFRATPTVRGDQHGNPTAVLEPILLRGGTPRLFEVNIEYQVKYALGSESVETVAVSYGDRVRSTDDGWLVEVDLLQDYDAVRDELFRRGVWTPQSDYGIYPLLLTLSTKVVNESWAFPEGEVDPNVLIEPGTFSNVVNGFGFVGSGYPLKYSWLPRQESIVATDFTDCPCDEVWCDYYPTCPGPYQ